MAENEKGDYSDLADVLERAHAAALAAEAADDPLVYGQVDTLRLPVPPADFEFTVAHWRAYQEQVRR